MHWIVQNDIHSEYGYNHFLTSLERMGVDHTVVKIVPFCDKILPLSFDGLTQDIEDVEEPTIPTDKPIVVFGTIRLGNIAMQRGWAPGIWKNDSFDYRVWSKQIPADKLLNPNGIVGTMQDISVPYLAENQTVFVRPVLDDKAFSGTVMSRYDFDEWRVANLLPETDTTPLHRNTVIVVTPYQKIYTEYRMFVVDGKVVTGSRYKQGKDVLYNDILSPGVLDFSDEITSYLDMARAYVLDIAETSDGYKVIEINTINSAGFYAADVQKLIDAIENMNYE